MQKLLIATVSVCALTAALARGQAPPKPQMAEDVFKNIQLLKGLPVDEFMDVMGFFSASTNLNCIDCHGMAAGGGWEHFADETPMKAKARKMMIMVQNLNKGNFVGNRVTCYTCHRGDMSPADTPSLAVQNSAPVIDPNETEVTRQAADMPTAEQVFDKYFQAIGGRQRLAGVTSFITKGTYSGYDSEFEEVAVETYAKAPDQRTTVVHLRSGDSITTFDGRAGWISEKDKPVPLIQLTGGEVDAAKADAAIDFPIGLTKLRMIWRVGPAQIDDQDVLMVQGTGGAPQPLKLYFDKESGLLVRQVRYVQLSVGRVPAQIDYSDYREAGGIKIPFKVVATWVDGRSTFKITGVQPNAPIDVARFAQPK